MIPTIPTPDKPLTPAFASPPCRHSRASFPRLLGVGLPPEGSSPHRAKPRQETVPLLTPRPYEA